MYFTTLLYKYFMEFIIQIHAKRSTITLKRVTENKIPDGRYNNYFTKDPAGFRIIIYFKKT